MCASRCWIQNLPATLRVTKMPSNVHYYYQICRNNVFREVCNSQTLYQKILAQDCKISKFFAIMSDYYYQICRNNVFREAGNVVTIKFGSNSVH